MAAVTLTINGAVLVPDASGALFWPVENLLVVADMHLEKGSAYAARGQMLPPYDSAATLAKLSTVLMRYKPARLLALGDSFHDTRAAARMDEACRAKLAAIAETTEMIWITGNHDPAIPAEFAGSCHEELCICPLVFRHEPLALPQPGEVAGHLHPVAKVVTTKGRVRSKAFVSDGTRLIMPAFGAYTGGLNLRDAAIGQLFDSRNFDVHVCGRTQVYPVAQSALFGD
ncbi:MAG: ligase-associated DNA damage response endonuclease PdeM [Beijerinckiaceae bacterium]